jgi:predicted dehydrogenase
MGDIGTHCLNLLETITGLEVREVCADLGTAVEGRALDDDGAVLLRLSNGARGVLHASQVAAGAENDLRIRVYGETGGLDWRQEEPNTLLLKPLGGPVQVLRSGRGYLSAAAKAHTRLPSGHPEGLIEAFANLYTDFADAIRAHHSGKPADPLRVGWPGIREAVRGMAFLQAVLKNSSGSAKWTRLEA